MSHLTMKLEAFLKQTNTFMRFLLVGVINTFTGLTVIFMLLNWLGWSYWLSTFTGNSAGAFISFLLNRTFTFQNHIDFRKGIPRFISVILLSYFFAYSISEFTAEWIYQLITLLPIINQDEFAILLGAALYTITNYLGQKYFVFKN